MENGENHVLVNPVNRRPAQVYVLFKIFRDLADLLIVIGTDVEFKIAFTAGKRRLGDKQFHARQLHHGRIGLIGHRRHFAA